MFVALTGIGLSAAAGLNAYIPFLVVALLARFTSLIDLPSSFAWIESGWAITIGAALLLTELVLDKIPIVDHINDAVATAIRPTVGGLVFAASASAEQLDNSAWMRDHPWIGAIGGAIVAGTVHVAKATARPVVNVSTVGLGAPVVSTAEDVTSVGLSFAAILAPILVIVVLAFLVWGFIAARRALRRWRATVGRVIPGSVVPAPDERVLSGPAHEPAHADPTQARPPEALPPPPL
jgi:hypothetical protein